MRVQLSPQLSPSHTTISGYKIPSQYNNTLPVSLKSATATATKVNYQQILDDGKEPIEPFTPNLLPINFCRTPGEYNKLLITNGKKVSSQHMETKTQGVPTVEFLNTPVHRRIHEKQERVKQYYRIKESQRQKSTASQVGECNCCCCDTFCQICNDEMHANFDDQPILSYVPKVEGAITRVKSQRATKSPHRKTLKIESQQSSNLNTKRKLKKQKSKQRSKQKTIKYLDQESEQYQRIKPLLQRSIHNQKVMQYNKLINDPTMIAYQKMQRAKQYDILRRGRSANIIEQQSSPKSKLPWNYNIPKEKAIADPYCHHHHEIQGIVFHPKPLKQKQDENVKCHPTGHHNNIDNQIMRKHYGDIAQSKLKQQRAKHIQDKIRVTNNLRKLDYQRRRMQEKCVKKKFSPKEQFNLDL